MKLKYTKIAVGFELEVAKAGVEFTVQGNTKEKCLVEALKMFNLELRWTQRSLLDSGRELARTNNTLAKVIEAVN